MVLTGKDLVQLCSLVGITCEVFDADCLDTPVKILEEGVILDGHDVVYEGGKVAFLEEYPEEGFIGLDEDCFV